MAAKRSEAEAARIQAEAAKTQAEANQIVADQRLDLANQAVSDMLVEVGADTLKNVPQMEGVRAALLEKVLLLYEDIGQTNDANDPDARFQTAMALFQVGEIQRLLGVGNGPEKSEFAYETAISELSKLCSEFPDELPYQQQLARSHMWLGELLREVAQDTRGDEAESHYASAIKVQGKLATKVGDSQIQYQIDLGRSHMNRGIVRKNKHDWDNSAEDYAAAEQHCSNALRDTARSSERTEECQVRLAKCHLNRGVLLRERYFAEPEPETLELATAAFQKAIDALIAVQKGSRRSGQSQQIHFSLDLAKYRNNQAVALLTGFEKLDEVEKQKHLDLAEREVTAVVDICESLNVGTREVRVELAGFYNTRAYVASRQQSGDAVTDWEKAADVLETVWEQNKSDSVATEKLAMIRCNICDHHMKRGSHDEALAAIEHLSKLSCGDARYERVATLMQSGHDAALPENKALAERYRVLRDQFASQIGMKRSSE
ncbi:MAG: hypothetical protein ACKVII_25240 [Planctomycetales bacterium]